uniref:LOW QUALITY PROTEIN: uncharacterized protein LOC111124979 n=1 Tax=Crassostrea virginica TaxID=6565 RepID=A0A8B8D936_CRAVI|nr:LOW QUALITY PROTEIN: uncharacterized protein LOC111124979 [Crassostrea virginica]
MDPKYSAQDVARCDLCKTAIAQSYCDFCHINLCKLCIGEHISDEYDKHKIVPILQRKSTLNYPKCEIHQNEVCHYQCKDCNIFVCTHCFASKQHKEHEFLKLEETVSAKKKHILKDSEELEEQILPTYEEIVIDLENQISNLDGEYKKLTSEMSKQREEIHTEVDNAFDQMELEIGEIKVKHHNILQKHLDEIKQLQSLMQQTLIALNEIEESNEVTSVIHYSSKNQQFSKLPPKVHVSMPKFIPKQREKEQLFSLIGKFTSLSTTLEERVFTAKKANTSVRELLDEPEVLSTIKTGHERLRSVTCLNEEQIWTSGETADIKCFSIQGALQKTIKTKPGNAPNDIAVDRDGALLYSGGITKTVYKVKNDQTEEIIRLQGWKPKQLCVTSSGDLLVTMCSDDKTQSKVVRYSGSTVKQTIQFDEEGQPLYSVNNQIKYISENRNLDICVADNGASAVVVVNQAGKLRFRYTGPPSSTKNKPFKPVGITTDSQSRILTSDGDNHCIHILDTDGQFLCYIDNCDLGDPYGLCVDSDDSLFVAKMDPKYSAQDVARCDLCKTAIAHSYCDFCHVNLCKPCIGEHISDEYDKHKIVPILQRKSTLKYPKCEIHQNEVCQYQCKDCNIFVCTHCFASKQHKEHEFLKLEESCSAKKNHILKDREELEEQILPTYEEIVIDLENQISNLDGEYKKLTSEMSKQREEIHTEVDNAFDQMELEIDEIKVKHHSILQKHLNEIKQLQSLMQHTLITLNEIEESNEVTSIIHYSSKNEQFSKLPPKVHVSMPKFIPKQREKEQLCSLIGKLTPLSTTLEERVFTSKKPNTSVRELLDEPEILSTIKTGHEEKLLSVTCLNEEQIWTSGMTADIKCFNIQGVLQITIKTKSGNGPNDITVDRDGALLYTNWKTKTVYKVKNDQEEEIITLQGWSPKQLCVTSSGDVLVTMRSDDKTQSKVVRYSGSTVKQTIQFDDKGQPLYSGNNYIKYISENRNLDICVADYGAGAVVVVNQAGKFRFRYTGPPSFTKKKPFKPYGITTDSQSHILTSDADNHCIHILDTDGQFLRYIDNCDLGDPYGLCLDGNDSVYVCEFYKRNVKKIRYSK